MASFFTTAMKSFRGGGEEQEEPKDGKKAELSNGMSHEEFEEYQRQLLEEKIQRDKAFAHKKAERATVRMHLRGKYRLPQSEQDGAQIQVAGGDVDLPEDLAAMVKEKEEEEEEEGSYSFLEKLQEMDLEALKSRAQGTFDEVKGKCVLM